MHPQHTTLKISVTSFSEFSALSGELGIKKGDLLGAIVTLVLDLLLFCNLGGDGERGTASGGSRLDTIKLESEFRVNHCSNQHQT